MDPILDSFADFAGSLTFRDLPESVVTAGNERVLDALGCALGGHDCETANVGRQTIEYSADTRVAFDAVVVKGASSRKTAGR